MVSILVLNNFCLHSHKPPIQALIVYVMTNILSDRDLSFKTYKDPFHRLLITFQTVKINKLCVI